jgi:hypothetical protein
MQLLNVPSTKGSFPTNKDKGGLLIKSTDFRNLETFEEELENIFSRVIEEVHKPTNIDTLKECI